MSNLASVAEDIAKNESKLAQLEAELKVAKEKKNNAKVIQHEFIIASLEKTITALQQEKVILKARDSRIQFSVRVHTCVGIHTILMSVLVNTVDLIGDVVDFSEFQLDKMNGAGVINAHVIDPNEELVFYARCDIVPLDSCKWTLSYLKNLKVNIEDLSISEFFKAISIPYVSTLSSTAQNLVQLLEQLSYSTLKDYDDYELHGAIQDDNAYKLHRLPITKSLFLLKYVEDDTVVDSFVGQLLQLMGFNDGMTYAIPKFSLPLEYGDKTMESIADYVVMDILSTSCQLFIIEDRNVGHERLNSTAQLFAEAVAMDSAKRKYDENLTNRQKTDDFDSSGENGFVGVRVNGTYFQFYAIIINSDIRNALKSGKSPTKATKMFQLGSGRYDFLDYKDRCTIIRVLDTIHSHISFASVDE